MFSSNKLRKYPDWPRIFTNSVLQNRSIKCLWSTRFNWNKYPNWFRIFSQTKHILTNLLIPFDKIPFANATTKRSPPPLCKLDKKYLKLFATKYRYEEKHSQHELSIHRLALWNAVWLLDRPFNLFLILHAFIASSSRALTTSPFCLPFTHTLFHAHHQFSICNVIPLMPRLRYTTRCKNGGLEGRGKTAMEADEVCAHLIFKQITRFIVS